MIYLFKKWSTLRTNDDKTFFSEKIKVLSKNFFGINFSAMKKMRVNF